MNIQEALSVMAQVTYKPGWRIEYAQQSSVHLTIKLLAPPWPDTMQMGGIVELEFFNTFNVALMRNRGKLLKAIRRLCHQAECHEADEWLKYQGVMVHNPHVKEV